MGTTHWKSELKYAETKNPGERDWFSNQPINAMHPDFIQYKWDFINAQEYDSTNVWVEIKDAGASVALDADADGGTLTITSAATTENDGGSIQSLYESFSCSSTKKMWFEAKVKIADADQVDAFIGLSDAFATNPEAVLAVNDRVGFQIDDGDASILCKSEKNGTEESTDSGKDLSDATYVKLGIYWNGSSAIKFYVDRALVATHTTTIPDDEQLAIAISQISGAATGTQSMTIDYISICQER